MHWLGYIKPVLSHIAAFAIVVYAMSFAQKTPSLTVLIKPLAALAVFIIGRLVYLILYKRQYAYILTTQRVSTEWGLLPWQKKTSYLTLDNIFEGYAKQSIQEKMSNYGNVVLIKRDGLRSEYILEFIPDPLGFLGQINQQKEFPAGSQQGRHATVPGGPVLPLVAEPATLATPFAPLSSTAQGNGSFDFTEKLEKLIQLKKDGDITPEEFDRLKAKLLQGI